MYKILIAEDDSNLRCLFQKTLEKNGYEVKSVSNGAEGIEALDVDYYDLIIADVMMPVMDGIEMVRRFREKGGSTPVMMVTALGEFSDMQRGFSSGSDDYMVKPVNINEMVLRIGALIRRAQMANERRQVIGKTTLDCDSLTVTTAEESLVLPQKEFMILYKMVSYPGKIFTRQQMLEEIWGYEPDSDTHTVDVHIGRLRDKFRGSNDFEIVTLRGVGYKVVKK